MPKSITVFIADDHPTMRLGLRVLLDQTADIEVVGEANNSQDAFIQLERTQPQVAILDCQLPPRSGIDVARQIMGKWSIKILALSAFDSPKYQTEMKQAGALGYLLKEEAPLNIIASVRALAQGQSLWSATQLKAIEQWQATILQRWQQLTEREHEVLHLLHIGQSNKDIAQTLKVTPRTVEFHLSNILTKLGVASRLEAVRWVQESGLDSI